MCVHSMFVSLSCVECGVCVCVICVQYVCV